jgi:hypothetical protein
MLRTVEGVFREGRVELDEVPTDADGARVLVTFLSSREQIRLQNYGITPEQATEARWRFASVSEDWDCPEMDVYNEL